MTISSVAAIANLIVLETKLLRAFKTESSNPDAMQLRYSVALRATANCLMRVGIEEEIAHKFIELASAIKEGSIPFLRSPKASGRTYDSQVIWNYRCYVVIGLECIVRSGKMKLQEAARYIAKEYPVFNRLKRNPSHSLATSIIMATILRRRKGLRIPASAHGDVLSALRPRRNVRAREAGPKRSRRRDG